MSNKKEELEYKIEKLHREKVQKELEEIRKSLSLSQKKQERISNKRRRENIYVLFALAIIGGFFSITGESSILVEPPLIFGFAIFVIASFVFVFIKINTVAFADMSFTEERNNNFDDYADYIFAFSINGVFLLALSIFVINTLNINIDAASPIVFTLVITLISAIISYLLQNVVVRRAKERASNLGYSQEEIKKELTEEIIQGINELKNASGQQEELNAFSELSIPMDACRDEFTKPEDFDPIMDELENLNSVSEEIRDSLKQNFSEAQEEARNKLIEQESLEQKITRFEKEYEEKVIGDE